MKKIILSMILVAATTGAFAQKSNVTKAKNKALMEVPDFAGARADIKPALTDPTTKDLASTWHVAGTIGYKESQSVLTTSTEVKGKAIMESYPYFLKAYELDGLPDAKGKIKPKFQKDIKAKLKEYFSNNILVSYGAGLYEKKKFDETINVFETYLGIPKLPMMNNELKLDSNYITIKYYTAIAATNASMDSATYKNYLDYQKKAIALYEDLKDDGYEELTVHQLLAEEYQKCKDTAKYVSTLKAGFEKFPQEGWFLQNLINYYIFSNKSKEAIAYLDNAISREPGIAQYRYVKGNLNESLGNLDTAREDFNKALELDPTLADAHAGIGRLFYNKAVKMSDEANDIKDNKLYNAAKKKADAVFAESIPYFKKASELKPDEMEYKRTLKTLYYRLKMDKEFEALEKEMNQ